MTSVPSYSGDASSLLTVQGDAPLSLPAGQFIWVLSLALVEESESGALERDRIGFSLPTVFELPQLSGGIAGEPDEGGLRLTLPGVYNPRPGGSLSGSLAVALWALAAVKGVGVKLAAAIVAGRPYAAMTDLLRVRGMGEELLAKLRHVLGL